MVSRRWLDDLSEERIANVWIHISKAAMSFEKTMEMYIANLTEFVNLIRICTSYSNDRPPLGSPSSLPAGRIHTSSLNGNVSTTICVAVNAYSMRGMCP